MHLPVYFGYECRKRNHYIISYIHVKFFYKSNQISFHDTIRGKLHVLLWPEATQPGIAGEIATSLHYITCCKVLCTF